MRSFFLRNKINESINVIEFDDPSIIKVINVFIHGIGTHHQIIDFKSDYSLNDREQMIRNIGVKSFALEFHGHGLSSGERCCIMDFDDLLDDLDTLIQYIKNKYQQKIILIAESMGGAVSIKYSILSNEISGLILLAPMIEIKKEYKPSFTTILCLTTLNYFFPKKQWIPRSNITSSMNDEYINAKKNNEYEYNTNNRLTTAKECNDACSWIQKYGKYLTTPCIIFHGTNDKITCPHSSRQFIEKIRSPNKQMILIENGDHKLFVENEIDDKKPQYICNKIINFINQVQP